MRTRYSLVGLAGSLLLSLVGCDPVETAADHEIIDADWNRHDGAVLADAADAGSDAPGRDAGPLSDAGDAGDAAGDAGPGDSARDSGVDAGRDGAGDLGPVDLGVDTAPGSDAGVDSGHDAGVDSGHDAGGDAGGPMCGEVRFSYAGSGSEESVLVSGQFNGWAATTAAGAYALSDPEGNGTWTAVVQLEAGDYQYKIIVDGHWMLDPSNPRTAQEGGITNSLLSVPDCAARWVVVAHNGPQITAQLHAELRFEPAAGGLDAATLEVSLDNAPLAPAAVTVQANTVTIDVADVDTGIHDLRITGADADGNSARALLKMYRGISTDWRDVVLYFAMTDRFFDGDPGNNRPNLTAAEAATDYQGGDFAGIAQKIEEGYFDDLGVGALWISWPVDNADAWEDGGRAAEHRCGLNARTMATVPARYTAYHGYWPQHLDQVEAHFGSAAELQELVDAAHAHGIRVMLDFTANHVHDSSPLFADHRELFNYPDSAASHICADVGWDTEPETCWFTTYMPDIDYREPAARRFMIDHALDWIFLSGADGFRVDAVKHVNMAFVEELRRRVREEVELTGVSFYMVGETFTGDTGLINRYVSADRLQGQFDFPLNLQVLKGFATDETGLDSMNSAARGIKAAYGGGLMSNFLGNHDISRFASLAAGDIFCGIWDEVSNSAQGWLDPPGRPSDPGAYDRLRLAFTYIMTIPGIPLIYYGDEYGMPGAGDPDNRRMASFGADLDADEQALLAFVQQLGQARAALPALRRGAWGEPLWSEPTLLAYPRSEGGEVVVVVLNRGDGARTVALGVGALGVADGVRYRDRLSPSAAALTTSGGALSVTVPPRGALLLAPEQS